MLNYSKLSNDKRKGSPLQKIKPKEKRGLRGVSPSLL
jgi:hypothetical protein